MTIQEHIFDAKVIIYQSLVSNSLVYAAKRLRQCNLTTFYLIDRFYFRYRLLVLILGLRQSQIGVKKTIRHSLVFLQSSIILSMVVIRRFLDDNPMVVVSPELNLTPRWQIYRVPLIFCLLFFVVCMRMLLQLDKTMNDVSLFLCLVLLLI